MNKLFWKVKSDIVKIRTSSQLWKLSLLFYSNLNTGTSIYLWVCRTMCGVNQCLQILFLKLLRFLSRFKTMHTFSKKQDLVGSFQTVRGFQMLGGKLSILLLFPQFREHRTLRLHVCHRTAHRRCQGAEMIEFVMLIHLFSQQLSHFAGCS